MRLEAEADAKRTGTEDEGDDPDVRGSYPLRPGGAVSSARSTGPWREGTQRVRSLRDEWSESASQRVEMVPIFSPERDEEDASVAGEETAA